MHNQLGTIRLTPTKRRGPCKKLCSSDATGPLEVVKAFMGNRSAITTLFVGSYQIIACTSEVEGSRSSTTNCIRD